LALPIGTGLVRSAGVAAPAAVPNVAGEIRAAAAAAARLHTDAGNGTVTAVLDGRQVGAGADSKAGGVPGAADYLAGGTGAGSVAAAGSLCAADPSTG